MHPAPAGVAFKSIRGRYTIISNCSNGATEVAAALDATSEDGRR
jgi:hypothetical protein